MSVIHEQGDGIAKRFFYWSVTRATDVIEIQPYQSICVIHILTLGRMETHLYFRTATRVQCHKSLRRPRSSWNRIGRYSSP